MTAVNQFQCDGCEKSFDARFNGEHWVPPLGWGEFVDSETGSNLGLHACPSCISEVLKRKSEPKDTEP